MSNRLFNNTIAVLKVNHFSDGESDEMGIWAEVDLKTAAKKLDDADMPLVLKAGYSCRGDGHRYCFAVYSDICKSDRERKRDLEMHPLYGCDCGSSGWDICFMGYDPVERERILLRAIVKDE